MMRSPLRYVPALLLALAGTAWAVIVEQIPSPRPGWAVDLTGTLSAEAMAELNRLGDEVKARTGAELAVVVVGTIDGADPRQFATRLANTWGIGERGKDNGLLVFAALDDRAAEIVLGDGIDDDARVRASEAIMQDVMIPRFREGSPAAAVLQGARACAERILGLQVSSSTGFRLYGPSLTPRSVPARPSGIPERQAGRENLWFPGAAVGAGLLAVVGLVLGIARRLGIRRCPKCKTKMYSLDEAADDAHLDETEKLEERIGSVDHQIWFCPVCGEAAKTRRNRWFSGYSACPGCSARTLSSTTTTVQHATHYNGGLVRVDERCARCTHSRSYTRSTPRLQSSSSSGSGSRSSSSGFGGGRSSGRGASGRW